MITRRDLVIKCKDLLHKKSIQGGELVFLLDGRRKGLIDFILIDIREADQSRLMGIQETNLLFPTSRMHLYTEVIEKLRHINFVLYDTNGSKVSHFQKILDTLGFMQGAVLAKGINEFHGKLQHGKLPPNML